MCDVDAVECTNSSSLYFICVIVFDRWAMSFYYCSCVTCWHDIGSDVSVDDHVLIFQMAVGMGVQIMSVEWVGKCWEQRDDSRISATDEHLVTYSICVFYLLYVYVCIYADVGCWWSVGHSILLQIKFCCCWCCLFVIICKTGAAVAQHYDDGFSPGSWWFTYH